MRPIIYSCTGKAIVFVDDQGRQWEDTAEIEATRLESPIVVPAGREVVVEMVVQPKFDLTTLRELGAESSGQAMEPEEKDPREEAMRRLGGFNHEIAEQRAREASTAHAFFNGLVKRPVL